MLVPLVGRPGPGETETVLGWHRAGFRLCWRWRSRPLGGRPKITKEIRILIRRLAQENQGWGAPKIHGELQTLGFVVSEQSVARYLRRMRHRGDRAKSWLTFLQNHREVIAAFGFFTVPTLTFQLLYSFFVIEHGRRRILRFNVTDHPTAEWIVQPLREAFPEAGPYRYAIFDRDSTFSEEAHPGIRLRIARRCRRCHAPATPRGPALCIGLTSLSAVEDGRPVFCFSLATLDEIFRTEKRHVTRLEFCVSSSIRRFIDRQVRRCQRGLDANRAQAAILLAMSIPALRAASLLGATS